jgi:hypothetical protein
MSGGEQELNKKGTGGRSDIWLEKRGAEMTNKRTANRASDVGSVLL